MKMIETQAQLYARPDLSTCPFTEKELSELDDTAELLVHVPRSLSAAEMLDRFGIKANFDPANEKMNRSVMVKEDQWFLTSASKTPELIYKSGVAASRIYEDHGLHGLDLRRYLAFCATFRARFGEWPDQTYWCFLLSGSYDRSGISIVGFDRFGVLSHHGWMRNFKSKFTGSRYAVIAPRIEITSDTAELPRARRSGKSRDYREAGMD